MEPQAASGRPPIIPPATTAVSGAGGDEPGDGESLFERFCSALNPFLVPLDPVLRKLQSEEAQSALVVEAICGALSGASAEEAQDVLDSAERVMEQRLGYLRDQLEMEKSVARPFRGDPVLRRPEDTPYRWIEVLIETNEKALTAIRVAQVATRGEE